MGRPLSDKAASLVNVKVPPFDLAYDYCHHQWGVNDQWCWRACVKGCGGVLPPRWLPYSEEMLSQDTVILDVILERIRSGATPRDACLSVGFSANQWQSAMSSQTPAAQDFRRLVNQAQATARVDASIILKTTKVETWALKGPGRKTASIDGQADTFGDEEKKLQITTRAPLDYSKLSPEDQLKLLELMEAAEAETEEITEEDN